MSWIETWLTRLESRLKEMFEGKPDHGGIPNSLHNQLLQSLVEALRANAVGILGENAQDRGEVPASQFTLILPTAQAQLMLSRPEELDRLAYELKTYADRNSIPLFTLPLLRVVGDPHTSAMRAVSSRRKIDPGDSATLELDGLPAEGERLPSVEVPNAFLIVNGLSTFHLTQAVINVGTDPTNQLVLDVPGVSHRHAQLRINNGHFVIFDLDSKTGTRVNGVVISSHMLDPGDVIMLAGVPLVYGEQTAPIHGYTQELPVEPAPPEVL